MVELKTPAEIEQMRAAGRVVANALAAVKKSAAVGVSLRELDEVARDVLRSNLDFGSHGVGRRMHEEPHVPNGGRPRRGLKLRAGHVFAIEPWFWSGPGSTYVIDADGWTLRSADHTHGAHAEHTVAITPTGPEILTLQ